MEISSANPIWASRSALLAEVAKTGAKLTENDDREYDIAVEAPTGFIWNSGEVHEMVQNCPDSRARSRNLVRADMMERMRQGMVPCSTPDCDWCGGAQ